MRTTKTIYTLFACILISYSGWGQHRLKKLGPKINTDQFDEVSPVLGENGKTLYFTRVGSPDFERKLIYGNEDLYVSLDHDHYMTALKNIYTEISGTKVVNPVSSAFNQDVWIASSGLKPFNKIAHPGFPLNSALPNSCCALMHQKNKMVIINQFDRDGSMEQGFSSVRMRKDGTFAFPERIEIEHFYNKSADVNLTISANGEIIILALVRNDTRGRKDLYLSFRISENYYTSPKNMGNVVNSGYEETTPFLTPDRKRLFFASNRPGTKGGMDIFYCDRLDYSYEKWTKPKPLNDVGINTVMDETYPVLAKDKEKFYFVSNRDQTSDIFEYTFAPRKKLKEQVVIKGYIKDALTEKAISSILRWGNPKSKKLENFHRTNNGYYEVSIKKNDLLKFVAQKTGYRQESVMVDPVVIQENGLEVFHMDILIYPKEKEGIKKVTLKNIYFVKTKAEVLEASFPSIKDLADKLKRQSNYTIVIEGHTDNVGDKSALLHLSRERAKAIKSYLVKEGISNMRIKTRGYGASRPLTDNSTEELREQNRRVEIRFYKNK